MFDLYLCAAILEDEHMLELYLYSASLEDRHMLDLCFLRCNP